MANVKKAESLSESRLFQLTSYCATDGSAVQPLFRVQKLGWTLCSADSIRASKTEM